jgi:hypothetical protein
MPAVSREQQRWAFAVKGATWARAHHFDQLAPGAPKRVKKRRRHGYPKSHPAARLYD